MPVFGKASAARLRTCDPSLMVLFTAAIAYSPVDFAITCGYRSPEDQDACFKAGTSKLKGGQSRHNSSPSEAVDIVPLRDGKAVWDADAHEWDILANHIRIIAVRLGIKVRWGGDFLGDGDLTTKDAWDKPHWELRA
jgi:peptidoglycan L-alanyl-D-glutamate endopeptidase CwlK